MTQHPASAQRTDLTKFAWLSIAAAIATITMKFVAFKMTNSVGLLSDAIESCVNLVAAVAALIALKVAAMPADHNHNFGHSKAEYFSAAIEGTMIFVAALAIIFSAGQRLISPQPLESVGLGLAISVAASVINGLVALVLLRAGREHRSITLKADGHHLMTDVVTSAGVVIAVAVVALTGIEKLDPIIAILVGLNIVWTGWKLLNESSQGLMDIAMDDEDNAAIVSILRRFSSDEVDIHALRTRKAGHRNFIDMHVLTPGQWTVQRGHDLIEEIEAELAKEYPDALVMCHLEPREDPRAYGDYEAEIPVEDPVVTESIIGEPN